MKEPNHYANIYNAYDKNPKKIRILDSTLREGEQHPGVSFTNKQRIQIAWMLDYFGVDQIEISPVVSNDSLEYSFRYPIIFSSVLSLYTALLLLFS